MEYTANQITIRGTLFQLPELSHENHGKQFYRFLLEVPRLSGAVDLLPVVVREDVLNQLDLSGGMALTIQGQIRSHNNHNPTGQRLLIFVYATSIEACDDDPLNEVTLTGTLCKPPIFRKTPLGREICDVMLAVPRVYRRSDYLPCILWGRTAQEISQLTVGDSITLTGRMQSRQYRKVTPDGEEIRTAYEISALSASCT